MYRKLASILVLLLGLSQVLAQEDLSSTEEIDEEVDISTRILEANQKISGFLMEGDVAIPRDRNARKCSNCKWKKSPSGLVEVPYNVSDAFSVQKKAVIENALQTFHEKTCIRFVPYVNQKDFIRIVSRGGCYSYVGRNGGGQTVSLSVHGCVYKGVVQHELLHALGFFHEQTRSDRDKYVKINWENIRAGVSRNFKKYDTNNLNTMYDYGSVMHYSRKAFSKNRNDTITPIPNPNVRIGQRSDLSEIDIVKINRLYECEDSETSNNETLKELMSRLEVTETQVKSLVGQVKSLVGQDKALAKQLDDLKQTLETKVAFSATLQSKAPHKIIGPFKEDFLLKYENVITNVGSAYDSKTGIFKAPVKGVYFFTFVVFNPHCKSASGVKLMKNGEMVVSATDNAPRQDTEDTTTNSVTLLLEPSDQVYIEMWQSRVIYTDGNRRNTFSGHLLYTM